MIDEEIATLITTFPLGFVATVRADGAPAVAPKGTFLVVDQTTIAFAHIRSPGTLANLAQNPRLEVNFIDILKRIGARVRGTARVIAADAPDFATELPRWQAIWPDLAHRIKALVFIDVTHVGRYRTPPYDDGATEAEMVALYKAKLAGLYQ